MDAITQLPGLFQQMEGEAGSKLMENLIRFTVLINIMNPDQLVSFYQAIELFGESQPKGTIFSRTAQYKMLKKVKSITKAKMIHTLRDCGYGGSGRASLIYKLERAIPSISNY